MISEAKTLRPSSNRVRLHTSEDVLNAFGEKHFVLMELRTKGLVPNKGQRRKISQAPNVFQFLLVMCPSSIPQNKELDLRRGRELYLRTHVIRKWYQTSLHFRLESKK